VTLVSKLPESLADGITTVRQMEAAPDVLLVKTPKVASYLVRDGMSIEVAIMAYAKSAGNRSQHAIALTQNSMTASAGNIRRMRWL
jgi:hypothetical protein